MSNTIIKIALLLFMMSSQFANAAITVRCIGPGTQTSTWVLLVNHLTVGTDTPAGTLLYTEPDGYNNQSPTMTCKADSGHTMLTWYVDVYNTAEPVATYSIDGHNVNIYPTGIKGIGVSFQDADPGSQNYLSSLSSTASLRKFSRPVDSINYSPYSIGNWLRIRLWRTAEVLDIGAANSGALTSVFPIAEQFVGVGDGFVLNGFQPGEKFIQGEMKISGVNLKIVPGTCNLPDTTVDMGEHFPNELSAPGKTSAWVQVPNFTLTNCPTAYGYGATGTGANTAQNNVSVTISPRTAIVSEYNGVFAIDETITDSAKGFGIQLAWGKASELPDTPSSLVTFNQPYLIKNFPFSDTTSSTIPLFLSARYIRTASEVSSGVANAIVEALVEYK